MPVVASGFVGDHLFDTERACEVSEDGRRSYRQILVQEYNSCPLRSGTGRRWMLTAPISCRSVVLGQSMTRASADQKPARAGGVPRLLPTCS
jgi:hypothetical protein